MPKFLLVTPVWNDSVRLEHFGVELAKALAVSGLNITWVIADDGSDTEVVQLERLKEKFSQIYSDVFYTSTQSVALRGCHLPKLAAISRCRLLCLRRCRRSGQRDELMRMLNCASDSENLDMSFVAVRHFSGSLAVDRSLLRKATFHFFRI